MKRVMRWMLNGMTVVSVVLLAATTVFWVRSYFVADFVRILTAPPAEVRFSSTAYYDMLCRTHGGRMYRYSEKAIAAASYEGACHFYVDQNELEVSTPIVTSAWYAFGTDVATNMNANNRLMIDPGRPMFLDPTAIKQYSSAGFQYWRIDEVSSLRHYRRYSIPFWFLLLVTSILPALQWRNSVRRRYRRATGLCPACGYDLRATPDRCPECGRMANTAAASIPSPGGAKDL
jgi:hypothetical protein